MAVDRCCLKSGTHGLFAQSSTWQLLWHSLPRRFGACAEAGVVVRLSLSRVWRLVWRRCVVLMDIGFALCAQPSWQDVGGR